MGSYALSEEADADITHIARASIDQWGFARAELYILSLHAAFERLVDFPDMGRDAGHIRAGTMRLESAHHVVFYRKSSIGILILRVLHQRMDFKRHL